MSLKETNGLKILERPENVKASLWRRFKFEGDDACREELFNIHQSYAKNIARRQFRKRPPYGLGPEDYEQLAYVGLIEAIERYDPMKGAKFEAFARFRIEGSITDGSVRSSEKGAQYKYRQSAEQQRLKSIQQQSRDDAASDSLSQLSEIVVGLAIGLILDGIKSAHIDDVPDTGPDAYETLSWRELKIALFREVTDLPKSEKSVVTYHYFKGLAFVQIARLLHLSKGRISQIHTSAIAHLRRKLKNFSN